MTIRVEQLTKAMMRKYIDDVVGIENVCFDHDPGFSDERWTKENYLSDYPGKWELSQIAFSEDGDVMGIYSVTKVADYCHANRLVVSGRYRRCGVGSALMSGLKRAAYEAGLKGLVNFVHYENEKSLCLHKKTGWTVCTGERLKYFANLKGQKPAGDDYVLTPSGHKVVMMFNPLDDLRSVNVL